MRSWSERPLEEASLLNPAFCSAVLTSTVDDYIEATPAGMPFVLAFLVLPVVLHKQTRGALPNNIRTSLAAWMENNPNARVGLVERIRSLTPYTREALLFGAARRSIAFSDSGRIVLNGGFSGLRKFLRTTTDETRACIDKARFLGRWFAGGGTEQTVLSLWGVRP